MNPYAIIAALLIAGTALSGASLIGYRAGQNAQSVADQKAIDGINAQLEANKAEAHQILTDAYQAKDQLETERARITNQLETEREKSRVSTDTLRRQLATVSLRYKAGATATGNSGSNSSHEQSGAASHADAAYAELPTSIAASLRAIAYDADSLRDDYALLYQWAHGVRCR